MFRRLLIILSTVLCACVLLIPAAQAQCSPDPGTSGNDTITCATDDNNGVNTGTGNDRVNITGGTEGHDCQ